MQTLTRACMLASFTGSCLLADVSYIETTKYTGGTLLEMTKQMANNPMMARMAGVNLNSAFHDQTSTVYVKGGKMARIGNVTSSIFDLDAGTVTTVNHEKQTYSVETFEEMKQRMEQAEQRMSRRGGNLEFDVKSEKTGKTRNINGQNANETILTLTAKNAGAQGQMVIKVESWLMSVTASTSELADFHKRMAQKFSYTFAGSSPIGPAAGGMGAAMREMQKLDGYPVLSNISVSGASPMAMMGGDPNAPMLQMEMESSGVSTSAIDDSKFAVPAGFKQEKSRR